MVTARLFLALSIAVIAHRGEHLHNPENTLECIRGAIDAGADYVELDVRTTKDGHLVLMHDEAVDRTTNGHGKVSDLSLEQIGELVVGNTSRVPTFDKALDAASGKISIYVDVKDAAAGDLMAALEARRMTQNVVVYGSTGLLEQLHKQDAALRVMPEAESAETVSQLIKSMQVTVLAFDDHDFNAQTISAAKSRKARVFVDRLGTTDIPAEWQRAIDRGADGIQTNHPAELVDYLRAHGLHR